MSKSPERGFPAQRRTRISRDGHTLRHRRGKAACQAFASVLLGATHGACVIVMAGFFRLDAGTSSQRATGSAVDNWRVHSAARRPAADFAHLSELGIRLVLSRLCHIVVVALSALHTRVRLVGCVIRVSVLCACGRHCRSRVFRGHHATPDLRPTYHCHACSLFSPGDAEELVTWAWNL